MSTRLSGLRQKSGQTQEEIGNEVGRSGGHISNVENGKTELLISEIEKLATFLGVHPLYLLAGITNDVTELMDIMTKMDPVKRGLALKLFKLNLETMEISKNWPSDAVNKL